MTPSKKSLILRNLVFWLGGGKIEDPDYVLQRIALDTNSTRDEVWEVYEEMCRAALGF